MKKQLIYLVSVYEIWYESVEVMKKILTTLVILFAAFYMVPVFACSVEIRGGVSGGACSIDELNNPEKINNSQEKVDLRFKEERNLRPVRMIPETSKPFGDDCLFGMCLIKVISGK